MGKYLRRVFISFDGFCPMKCKHCYTYEMDSSGSERTNQELVNGLEKKEFDIIYLSQTYENFFDEQRGIDLCIMLYERYKKDIYIITRSRLSDRGVQELAKLNQAMGENGNRLYVAVSVCGNESYGVTEDICACPAPIERINNLKTLHNNGVSTILLVRPLFPDKIIKLEECKKLIAMSFGYVDGVISSGLAVTEGILQRLGFEEDSFEYIENGNSEYLANIDQKKVRYVNVERELKELECYCKNMNMPFFRHSMPALNYIAGSGTE